MTDSPLIITIIAQPTDNQQRYSGSRPQINLTKDVTDLGFYLTIIESSLHDVLQLVESILSLQ